MYIIKFDNNNKMWYFIDSHGARRNYHTYEQAKAVRDSYFYN